MSLYVLGSNFMGQLGIDASVTSTSTPFEHPFFKDKEIRKIATGKLHALVLCADNKLYSWGVNDDCALGREGDPASPQEIPFSQEIVDISAGASHSMILTSIGQVFGCGTFKSSSGVFGFMSGSKEVFQKEFKRIENMKGIKKIFSGHNHVVAIDKEENLWTFGANEALQLGRRHSLRHSHRSLNASQVSVQVRSSPVNSFITGAAGGCHSLVINRENEPFSWGGNYNGQLGDGTEITTEFKRRVGISGVKGVACGSSHSLFLLKNGDLYGCGDNTISQVGVPGMKMYTMPRLIVKGVDRVEAGCDFTVAQKGNTLVSWGSNLNGELGFDEIEFDEVTTPREIDFDFGEIVDFKCGTDFMLIHANKSTN